MKSISEWIIEIESNFEVEKITSKGVPIWPFYKVFLFDQLYVPGGTLVQHSFTDKLQLAKQALFGIGNYFDSDATDVAFSTSEQRKEVNGEFPDKLIDGIRSQLSAESKLVHLELPVTPHRPAHEIPNKNTASKLPLRLLEWYYDKKASDLELQGSDVVASICQKTETTISLAYVASRFWAQYTAMSVFLNKKKKIQRFWVVSSYMNFGAIHAAKERGIEVIEIQHGTITKEHFGYFHTRDFKATYFPDYLLTFGENEALFFKEQSRFVQKDKIYPIGHFYIESIYQSVRYEHNSFNKPRITVSLQDDEIGEKVVPFMIEVAKKWSDCNVWFSPRRKSEAYYRENFDLPVNIFFNPQWNVYESIAHGDLHTTVYSTCAIESPSLGTPNVIANIAGRGKAYFGDFLSESEYTWYANSAEEYIEIVKQVAPLKFKEQNLIRASNNQNIKADYFTNVEAFLKQLTNKS